MWVKRKNRETNAWFCKKTIWVKYLKSGDSKMALNEKLIEKSTKLLGIKGYTDIEESVADNAAIIDRYHDLYKIEQAFRVSKHHAYFSF